MLRHEIPVSSNPLTIMIKLHLSLIFGTVLILLSGCQSTDKVESPEPTKPNLVYIICDDLGYGDVSALNPRGKIPTPHIDRLAEEGMIFTDAHSSSSVCTPTRYNVLTGR